MKLNEETQNDLDRLISVTEAAIILGVTEIRIRQYIMDGLLPCLKRNTLVDPDDLALIKGQLRKRGRKSKNGL